MFAGAQTLEPTNQVRKESRTRATSSVCMLAQDEPGTQRRLQAQLGTTNTDPHATTLPDALAALCLRRLLEYRVDKKTAVTRQETSG